MKIQRFASRGEAETGADWEWWIRDERGYVGFRIQAKRADPTTRRVRLDQQAASNTSSGYQVEVFADRCRSDRIAGFYCVYSDAQTTWRLGAARPGPCPHGPVDLAQWGCAIVPAETALDFLGRREFRTAAILAAGAPSYQLVCHAPINGIAAGVRGLWRSLTAALTDDADRPDAGPPPAEEPPPQIEAWFRRDLRTLERWSGLAGVVLVDATDAAVMG